MKEFITPAELAEKTGMSLKFVKNHIQLRDLPGMCRFGRHWRFKKSEVEKRFLNGEFLLDTKAYAKV